MRDFGQSVAVVVGCERSAVILTEQEWETGINKGEFIQRAQPFEEIAGFITSRVDP